MPHKAVAFSLNLWEEPPAAPWPGLPSLHTLVPCPFWDPFVCLGTVRPSSLARASKIWDSLDPFPPSQLPFPLTPFTLRSFLTLNSFIQHQQSLSEWLTGSFSHYHYEYQLRPTFFISTCAKLDYTSPF
ncbi:hypothetical protein FOVSG1_003424 [Fusarium oxysporum f. sp. vasinfectum]